MLQIYFIIFLLCFYCNVEMLQIFEKWESEAENNKTDGEIKYL